MTHPSYSAGVNIRWRHWSAACAVSRDGNRRLGLFAARWYAIAQLLLPRSPVELGRRSFCRRWSAARKSPRRLRSCRSSFRALSTTTMVPSSEIALPGLYSFCLPSGIEHLHDLAGSTMGLESEFASSLMFQHLRPCSCATIIQVEVVSEILALLRALSSSISFGRTSADGSKSSSTICTVTVGGLLDALGCRAAAVRDCALSESPESQQLQLAGSTWRNNDYAVEKPYRRFGDAAVDDDAGVRITFTSVLLCFSPPKMSAECGPRLSHIRL